MADLFSYFSSGYWNLPLVLDLFSWCCESLIFVYFCSSCFINKLFLVIFISLTYLYIWFSCIRIFRRVILLFLSFKIQYIMWLGSFTKILATRWSVGWMIVLFKLFTIFLKLKIIFWLTFTTGTWSITTILIGLIGLGVFCGRRIHLTPKIELIWIRR